VRVTLELFVKDERIEGCLRAPHRPPVDFTGVLGLLHAIEQLDLEPAAEANADSGRRQRTGEISG
jgi:hypothetical protein